MKILLLATDVYGGHGGIALFNREFVSALVAMEEVEEVVVLPRVIPRPDQNNELPPRTRFLASAAGGAYAYTRALRQVSRERFDLVVCGHVNLLRLIPFLGCDPLLVTHGIDAWKAFPSEAMRRLLHRCRGIVSVSALTRDRLRAWSEYRGPMHVLPNAVHFEQYGIRPRRADLIERYGLAGKRVLLTIGRLVSSERYKGFDEVMEVLPNLPPDVVYLIGGGGNDLERLRQRAAELGVADRVILTGFFAEEEKPDLYNLADVYVMPSRGEGFGFVFLEAMACGVPVIGSRRDGGREALLGGELGLVIDPCNLAEIEAAIREQLAVGRREIPPGLDYFSFENFQHRVANIVRGSV